MAIEARGGRLVIQPGTAFVTQACPAVPIPSISPRPQLASFDGKVEEPERVPETPWSVRVSSVTDAKVLRLDEGVARLVGDSTGGGDAGVSACAEMSVHVGLCGMMATEIGRRVVVTMRGRRLLASAWRRWCKSRETWIGSRARVWMPLLLWSCNR